MKSVLGIILMVLGILVGLFVGLYVCFIGGIVDILNEIKRPGAVQAMSIAWGIAKIFLAGFAGWLSALLLIIPGYAMLKD